MKADLPVNVQRAPSAAQLRTFGALAAVYLGLTVGLLRWAAEPAVTDPHIVVVYGIAVLLADLFTASLLGAMYRSSGRTALLLLACGYFYGGVMAGLHMATFPGALFAQPLFGNGQTVGWLYLAWRLGMAALFLAAIWQAGRERATLPAPRRDRALFAACALVLAVAAVAASLAARSSLLQIDADRFAELARAVQWGVVALCALGLALIWRRRAFNDVLYLWLGLVLVASISDLALSNAAGAPFTVGWHAARASLLVSSCLLLAFLLGDLADDERARAKAPWMPAAYGGAAAVTLGAVLLRWFLDPWLGESVPYTTLYGAVAIAVWFGGVGPAVLATVLGYAIANVRYIAPEGALEIVAPADAIALALFSLSCSLIIVLGEAMRRARDRYRASEVELKEHARQLQRADSNKSRFLAVMAHELRNPLAPLRTGVALLRLRHEDPATRETHDMMERQIAQLTRLIDDLLDVSRIDRGKLELRSERVSVESVMRTAVDTARPNLDAKGHILAVRAPPAPLFVQGDPVRLSQVLSNLLNNAAKFTPANGRIEICAAEEAGQVVVSVSDNGVGIAPEHLKEVFDMFVQLDNASLAPAGGLGLGLTLARSIVERHRGSIEARSAGRGKGAQFVVRLPLAPAPAKQKPDTETPRAKAARRRVLVVDDNVDAAQTLAQYLRLDGHRVESALDGEGALRIAEVLHPDIAFIDLNMPGMDGIEVAKRLRVTSWGRGAHLVALTGMGQQADVARTREAGFDEHLTKPADLQRVSRIAAGMNGDARSASL